VCAQRPREFGGHQVAVAGDVPAGLIDGQQGPLGTLAGWVADQAGTAAEQRDGAQGGAGAADDQRHGQQVADGRRVCGGVEPDADATAHGVQMLAQARPDRWRRG